MVQHILVAHDLSPEADLALRRGVQLARQNQARLSLLHVLDAAAEPAAEKRARERLQTRLQEYGCETLEPWIRRGQPTEEVLTLARGLEVDLLVLGQHHRQSPLGFAGTTLERILLATPAPLLLVVGEAEAPYTQALAALDFSPCASRAMQCAWTLLPGGAGLHAMNIHEVAEIHAHDAEDMALQQELFEQLIEDIQVQLPERDIQLSYSLHQGERENCLESTIADIRPQLLALGGHSRGELSSALLGSLTRRFLDQPPCDVLVAR